MIDLAKLNINDIFYAINERIDICGNINVAVNLFKVINKLNDESVLAENISLNIIPEHKRLVFNQSKNDCVISAQTHDYYHTYFLDEISDNLIELIKDYYKYLKTKAKEDSWGDFEIGNVISYLNTYL
jgi:hypothetical protein